ncbi:hypothetical protein FDI40_gp667 [Agrobacterium phage Atu_ph07]|uniref:Uncharacterized protein n=1 Tax=Agrobacterium phage Atu_ph07 TaxID=2024264 RepID=A0A2L0V0V0_9CAUD|nr:hypothetical protein FDI40_gp667 [Agrobacterium phage Atu_ph07]AUZ95424.1 hypothetical protein [Agrobacterium phage Atu_ph07]
MDKYTPKGHTKATVEMLNDSKLTSKLTKTEQKYGIETGVRFKKDGHFVVSVLFYPKVTFYIQKINGDGTLTVPLELTKEEYSLTWGLKL